MLRTLNALTLRLLYMIIFAVAGSLFIYGMFTVPAAGLLFLGVLAWRQAHRRPALSSAHGTARWASFLDLFRGQLLSDQGLILGRLSATEIPSFAQMLVALFLWRPRYSQRALDMVRLRGGPSAPIIVRLPDQGIPHLAAFGASGSGKSTCYVIPNLRAGQVRDAVVVLDPKGEIFLATAKFRARHLHHQIIRIDPFNIAPSKQFPAQGFNPLSLTDPTSPLAVDDARRLASALVVRNPNSTEPFWENGAQIFIQAMIAFLFAKAGGKEATLNSLRDILCSPVALKQAIRVMQDAPEFQGLLSRMAGQLRSFQGKTRSSTMAVVNTQLDFLDSLPVAATLAQTTFDPRQLLRGGITIYLCLPVDRIRELTGLQRIFITSLINMIFQAGESRTRRIRFYLDEAVTLGEIDALYNAVVYGRSFGIRLFFLFQSASQVELCFPKSKADDFRATVGSLWCGTSDFRSAQEISQWIGQTAAHTYSTQTSHNSGTSSNTSSQGPSQGINSGYSRSDTLNETARALIRPEEVLQLSPAEAIVLLPHLRPVRLLKMPYYVARRRMRRLLVTIAEYAVLLTTCVIVMAAVFAYSSRHSHVLDQPDPSPATTLDDGQDGPPFIPAGHQ
jgi:type IV secretion system protein VirD4